MKTAEEMWEEVGPFISIEEALYTPEMFVAVLDRLTRTEHRVTFSDNGVVVTPLNHRGVSYAVDNRNLPVALLEAYYFMVTA